ncbi:MAG TPA: hypothetical protein PK293_06600, partial [Spirochaetota bacterium]|nr:hypothetical protein [Spirochaetota bacterium]
DTISVNAGINKSYELNVPSPGLNTLIPLTPFSHFEELMRAKGGYFGSNTICKTINFTLKPPLSPSVLPSPGEGDRGGEGTFSSDYA